MGRPADREGKKRVLSRVGSATYGETKEGRKYREGEGAVCVRGGGGYDERSGRASGMKQQEGQRQWSRCALPERRSSVLCALHNNDSTVQRTSLQHKYVL